MSGLIRYVFELFIYKLLGQYSSLSLTPSHVNIIMPSVIIQFSLGSVVTITDEQNIICSEQNTFRRYYA